jgi:hypothetical protein
MKVETELGRIFRKKGAALNNKMISLMYVRAELACIAALPHCRIPFKLSGALKVLSGDKKCGDERRWST